MLLPDRLGIAAATVLLACGGSPSTREGNASSGAGSANATSGGESNAARGESASSSNVASGPPGATAPGSPASNAAQNGAMDVSGHRGDPNSIDVEARSDLPDPVPSTARPYAEIVETNVAPLRPALRECFASLSGRAAPRFFAITVESDGAIHPRSPQPVALPPRVASCAEGLLNATTVNPPPPRPFAFDIFLRPERSR